MTWALIATIMVLMYSIKRQKNLRVYLFLQIVQCGVKLEIDDKEVVSWLEL